MICIKTPYPISTNRYYRTFRNITTISKEGRIFKQTVQLENLHIKPIAKNIILNITIHPKQKKDGSSYIQLIDLDNSLKCILDSLIGIVYKDDKQVKKLQVEYGSCILGGGATILVSQFDTIVNQ